MRLVECSVNYRKSSNLAPSYRPKFNISGPSQLHDPLSPFFGRVMRQENKYSFSLRTRLVWK